MAARLRGRGVHFAALTLALLLAGACVGAGQRSPGAAQGPPLATPLRSLTPGMASTVAVLRAALEERGLRVELSERPFRPSEPERLTRVPRAVLQVDVGDPRAGWVVVYEVGEPSAAGDAGAEFARHLASGFGQTNYPLDARFALSQLAGTLVFSWWSPERSARPELAEQAFEAISAVGQPIPVRR